MGCTCQGCACCCWSGRIRWGAPAKGVPAAAGQGVSGGVHLPRVCLLLLVRAYQVGCTCQGCACCCWSGPGQGPTSPLLLISVWQAGFTCNLLLLISGYQVGFTCTESTPGSHVAAALIRAQPMSRAADRVQQVEGCCAM